MCWEEDPLPSKSLLYELLIALRNAYAPSGHSLNQTSSITISKSIPTAPWVHHGRSWRSTSRGGPATTRPTALRDTNACPVPNHAPIKPPSFLPTHLDRLRMLFSELGKLRSRRQEAVLEVVQLPALLLQLRRELRGGAVDRGSLAGVAAIIGGLAMILLAMCADEGPSAHPLGRGRRAKLRHGHEQDTGLSLPRKLWFPSQTI